MVAKKKRILVVDDDPQISDLITEFCQDSGYDAKAVNNSEAALAVAQAWEPDLITLDLEMPGKDGLKILSEVRHCEQTKNIPVVIISVVAKEIPSSIETVQGLFTKPIKFNALFEKINVLLKPASPQ
ncbi:MAG TPA: response regulator [Elusimicrobiota bacterium]|nr:response regulator [Elusimicrobiota bacterium]